MAAERHRRVKRTANFLKPLLLKVTGRNLLETSWQQSETTPILNAAAGF